MKNIGDLRYRARPAVIALMLVLTATPMTVDAATTSKGQASARAVALGDVSAIDTSGIPLVLTLVEAKPTSEDQAQALSDALEFAQGHPDDIGYPWIGPASGDLVLSAASATGVDLLAGSAADVKQPTSVRNVAFSFGKLEAIKDEAIRLQATGVPDADLIYMTGPDPKSNRITIVVSAPSERLFEALANRFGTQAIESRIDASMLGAKPTSNRQADAWPFWGGASIQSQACSDGFAWHVGTVYAMLTAAHCFSTGGSAKIGNYSGVGWVKSGYEENWNSTYGTQYYTGQTTYRGDVALIRLYSGYPSQGRIFRGNVDSSSWSPVVSRYTRFAQFGDAVYVGGRASGETGPYSVDLTGWDISYGGSLVARNMSSALSWSGPCVLDGDSGGSIFSIVSGVVKAAGVQSGAGPGNCRIYFTPIYDSYLALPGDILLN